MNAPALLATYQLRQREYLLRITRAMTSRLDLPSLLRLILSGAVEMVGCRAGLIVLAKDSQSMEANSIVKPLFEIRAAVGISVNMLSAFEPLLDVMPILSEYDNDPGGMQLDPHFLDLQGRVRQIEERLDMSLGQVIGLPLLFEDALLGVIYLFRNEYAFTQLDWQFLQGFADQAATAVRNARLYTQLETERTLLSMIVEHSGNGVLILDAERRVLVVNQVLADLLEKNPEELVGLLCHEVLPLDNVQGTDLCQPDEALEFTNSEVRRCEGDLNRPGRKRVTLTITFTPLFDEANRLVNIIISAQDITRFREEEEMKNTFSSIISHELKTPVALIKGYAQTLARPDAHWDAETARQSLQIIEEEADRLEALINNLLDASRIQAGGLKLDLDEVDIEKLSRKVADAYRTQTNAHKIEVDFPEKLPLVWGDEERLRQVLTNLMSNAIKYSPNGGRIRLGGWQDFRDRPSGVRRVVLYVADEGIGIPAQELPHIFERFYRVDTSLRRTAPGAGLGLYLCKAIIDAHSGQIWVRSEPEKGTTFFIGLPLAEDRE
ncbi:MAG: ATP-binding protein [Caldilineaceae bacterium]